MTDRAILTRDFTVAVFVVHERHLVLHRHPKLGIWLPPGGHIEPNELPDEAAHREVLEETGLTIELMGERGIGIDYPGQPRQLVRPEGIQLESIGRDHEHIDLIYLARLASPLRDGSMPALAGGMSWYTLDDLAGLQITEEVRDWSARAVAASARW